MQVLFSLYDHVLENRKLAATPEDLMLEFEGDFIFRKIDA